MGCHAVVQIGKSCDIVFPLGREEGMDDVIGNLGNTVAFKQVLHISDFRDDDLGRNACGGYGFIQFACHPVYIGFRGKAAFLIRIFCPFSVRFIDRADIVYLIAFVNEMFGTCGEEGCEIIEFVFLQVDIFHVR